MANLKTALAKANEERDQALAERDAMRLERDTTLAITIRMMREVRERRLVAAAIEDLLAAVPDAFEGWTPEQIERLTGPGGRDPIFMRLRALIDEGNGVLALVAAERERQLTKWSREHDDEHQRGELAVVAAELLVHPTDERLSWKLRDDRVRALTVAAALAVAELERVLRQEERERLEREAAEAHREAP